MVKLQRVALFTLTLAALYLAAVGVGTFVEYQNRSLIERLTGVAIQSGEGSYTLTKFREIERYPNVDVLVLGSSHAVYGYDVRVFEEAGLDVFNVGTLAQAPTNSHHILQRYWEVLRPCMVVYELYPAHLAKRKSLGPVMDMAANTPPSWHTLRMAFAEESMYAINIVLSAYWQQLFRPIGRIEQVHRDGYRYVPGGYVEVSDTLEQLDTSTLPETGPISDAQVEHLRKTIRFLKRQNTPVVLTTHPLPEGTRKAISNYDQAEALLHEIADEEQVPYLNFNEILPLDTYTYFYDPHHLNAAGARRFTRQLLDELQQLDTGCLDRASPRTAQRGPS